MCAGRVGLPCPSLPMPPVCTVAHPCRRLSRSGFAARPPTMSDASSTESLEVMVSAARDFSSKMDLLNFIRRKRLRVPGLVLEHGESLLRASSYTLGDDAWSLREQVFQAALDLHQYAVADTMLESLKDKFPDSKRVLLLVGLREESMGEFEEALKVYNHLLEDNPANGLASKRKVCVLKATGMDKEAIATLNAHLLVFAGDTSGWQELADLHLKRGALRQAMFCYEELLLAEPVNHMYHTKYAEMVYTAGAADGVDAYRLARSHFAQAVQLNGKPAGKEGLSWG